jgi:hypothetical protein
MSHRQTGPLKCRRGLESNDDSRLVQAMTTKTAKHRWVGQQAGGRPDDASSYEWVRYCDVCGVERNEDNRMVNAMPKPETANTRGQCE